MAKETYLTSCYSGYKSLDKSHSQPIIYISAVKKANIF